MTGPYGEAAWLYYAAGWRGVLHLPVAAKWPPPSGYTGWAGIEPSGADVQAWCDGPEAAGNIALRLPDGVYGLDVDAYGSKQGGAALAAAMANLGPLPPTWTVTSRDDNTSGIRLFRAAAGIGRRWKDEPAGHGIGIEAIHFGHRYAVVWPSVHPDTGQKYRWYGPDGHVSGEVPRLDALPDMPVAWVEALSEPGEIATGEAASHADTLAAVDGFVGGDACERMTEAHGRGLDRLRAARDGAALHPAARDATHELVRLGHEGHSGARRALAEHYAAFVAVRVSRGGHQRDAEGEWWRLARGAVGKLSGDAHGSCDCALLSGEGLDFTEEAAAARVSVGGDVAASEPQGVEGGLLSPEVRAEAQRLYVRHQAEELFGGWLHARTWTEPVSRGDLATELLLPDDEPQWRIHGLLGNGHNAIVVAGRKTGKTTMVNELVRSYVDGGRFLGTQEVISTGASVAVFNYEVDERQYRRWLRSVGVHNADRVHVLHLRGKSLPLRNGRVRKWVTDWLRDRGIGMWILDPYSRAYIGSLDNGNDEAQVSAFLDTLDVIKSESGVSELVMPVHTPKARAEAGEESAIGSQRLEGWPDVMWYLTRDGKDRFIRAEGRDIDFDETQLHFNESTRRLHVELFGQDRKTARLTAGTEKLIAYVRANPECTQNMIMAGLGWNAKTVRDVVAACGDRIVVETGRNRSLVHLLKEDISGVTQIQSHTASDRVTPNGGEWCDVTTKESRHTTDTGVTDSGVTHTPVTPNPFDLDGGTP